MTENYKKGFDCTMGILGAFGTCYMIGSIIVFLLSPWINPTDPTDQDSFNRSGLHYYKDYGTGKEYISGGGSLIERLK